GRTDYRRHRGAENTGKCIGPVPPHFVAVVVHIALFFPNAKLPPARRAAAAGKPVRNVKCLTTSYDEFQRKLARCVAVPPTDRACQADERAPPRSLRDHRVQTMCP